jgi:hypothetical protein
MWQPVAGIPTGPASEGSEMEINREGRVGAPYGVATGVRAWGDRSRRLLRATFLRCLTHISEFSDTRGFSCPLNSSALFGC